MLRPIMEGLDRQSGHLAPISHIETFKLYLYNCFIKQHGILYPAYCHIQRTEIAELLNRKVIYGLMRAKADLVMIAATVKKVGTLISAHKGFTKM
jgi:hypothetical protein